MQLSLTFEPSEAADAAALIGSLTSSLSSVSHKQPHGIAHSSLLPQHEIIRLYERMAENKSPRFLESLTEQPASFEEIAERMTPQVGAKPNIGSVRAIYRNIRRREKGLIEAGILSAPSCRATSPAMTRKAPGAITSRPRRSRR